jgi:hypothetical protein
VDPALLAYAVCSKRIEDYVYASTVNGLSESFKLFLVEVHPNER